MSRQAALLAASVLLLSFTLPVRSPAQSTRPDCEVDLSRVGMMDDILSNALTRDYGKEGRQVQAFLKKARLDAEDGPDLLRKTAVEYGLTEEELTASVERFRHINCGHWEPEEAESGESDPHRIPLSTFDGFPLSTFAEDVTLHVVLHELGHALIREFDLPVLGNEETMADAFATHYLTTYLPDRAVAVLRARVASLMFEAGEVPRSEWTVSGEHGSDARRAFQIAALAIAADPEAYRPVAEVVEMSSGDQRSSADYGAEIHRSWRRILEPLWMPEGQPSNEARLRIDEGAGLMAELRASALKPEIATAVRRFDWHSQVTVRFTEGEGGAGWSRSKRTVTVYSEYVERFIAQGEALALSKR